MNLFRSLFVDTSAIIALLDGNQQRHHAVWAAWEEAIRSGRPLLTSNYVVVETLALVQQRMSMDAVRALAEVFFPLMKTHFVSPELHAAATSALLVGGKRWLSLVDCTSFELMRQCGVTEALALDPGFADQGFGLLPKSDA